MAGAQQCQAGFATQIKLLRSGGLACGNSELNGSRVVYQQEAAKLVLYRHTGREHFENIAQNFQLDVIGEFAITFRPDILQMVLVAAVHGR